MKRIPRSIIILGILAIICAGAVGYYIYNKPHEDILHADSDFELTTKALYAAFKDDAQSAAITYIDKILLVTGNVGKVESVHDTVFIVLLEVEGAPLGNVKCAIDPAFNTGVASLQPGDKVSIKGRCSGSSKTEEMGLVLLDVEMTRCVIP